MSLLFMLAFFFLKWNILYEIQNGENIYGELSFILMNINNISISFDFFFLYICLQTFFCINHSGHMILTYWFQEYISVCEDISHH